MGRIISTLNKKTAKKLAKEESESFTGEFEAWER